MIGSRTDVPSSVLKAIDRTQQKTANNTGGTLALCFNYGGRQELVDAVKTIVAKGTAPADVTDELISASVYQPQIPSIDLLIRTSGEARTSGFMLWRADYAELLFVDKMWPDFTTQDLDAALADYASRKRRFGKWRIIIMNLVYMTVFILAMPRLSLYTKW